MIIKLEVLDKINSVIWGSFTVILILVIGIYFTVKSRFIQFTFIKKLSLKKQGSIGAVTAALAASLGMGNITGCAAAIAVGGIGAIFWMWVSAFFGMAIAYAENHVGISCIQKYGGSGPMSYMENMIGSKVLAVIYAIGCGATALFVGSATQATAFVTAVSPYFNISSPISGTYFGGDYSGYIAFRKQCRVRSHVAYRKNSTVYGCALYGRGCGSHSLYSLQCP